MKNAVITVLTLTLIVVGYYAATTLRMPNRAAEGKIATLVRGDLTLDVGVDQGGCCETIRPTTHEDPTYIVDHIVHYGVANMPGAVGRTSTYSLTNATLPFALELADRGYKEACSKNAGLAAGINIAEGKVANKAVADAFDLEFVPAQLS